MNLLRMALESDARRQQEIEQAEADTRVPDSELEVGDAPPAPDTDPPSPEVPATDAARGTGRDQPAPAEDGEPPEIDVEVELPTAEVDDEGTVVENGLGDAEEVEGDLVRQDQEQEAEFTDNDTRSSAMEQLMILESNLESIIVGKRYTPDTAGLIRNQINHQLSRVGAQVDWSAMESDADDVGAVHKFALEGIREGLKTVAQQYSMQIKHIVNAVADTFSTTSSAVNKYEQQLDNLEKQYNEAKGSWKEQRHTANMTSVWFFFTTDKGVSKEVVADATKDLAMSSYVLGEYQKLALDTLTKAIATVGAARLQTKDQAVNAFASLEKFDLPATKFKPNFIGGQPYFNKTGLLLNQGSKRSPVTFAGKTFEKLAQLASPTTVVESSSLGHKAKKGINFTYGSGVSKENHEYSSDDVKKIIEIGRKYIANVRGALTTFKTFESSGEKWMTVLDNFFIPDFKGEPLSGEDAKAYDRLCFQVAQMADNLTRNFTSPATAEMARSLRGAKYCGYMATSMIRFAK